MVILEGLRNEDSSSSSQQCIWACIKLCGGNTTKTTPGEFLEEIRICFNRQFQKEYQKKVWTDIHRHLSVAVMERLEVPLSRFKSSWTYPSYNISGSSRLQESLQLTATHNQGVIVNLTKLASLTSLSTAESDEINWQISSRNVKDESFEGLLDWLDRPLWAWKGQEHLFANAVAATLRFVDEFRWPVFSTIWNTYKTCQIPSGPPDLSVDDKASQVCIVYKPTFQDDTAFPIKEGDDDRVSEREGIFDEEPQSRTDKSLEAAALHQAPFPAPNEIGGMPNKLPSRPDCNCANQESRHCNPAITCDDRALHWSQNATVVSPASQDIDDNRSTNDDPSLSTTSVMPAPTLIAVASPSADVASITPDPKREELTEIDSHGIDLGVLSQLPEGIRSEARIVVAIEDRKRRNFHLTSNIRQRFFQAKNSTNRFPRGKRVSEMPCWETPVAKKSRSIYSYFGEKC